MQLTTLILASIATIAAAQSTSSSSCPGQLTLDACKSSIQGQINSCGQTDYSCLCTQYVNMLTCYANCPSDPSVGTVQQQRDQYCQDASVYGSTTTLGTAPATTAGSTAATTTGSSITGFHTGFASETGSAASASASATASSKSDNAAASLEMAGGVVALAVAGLGLVL
ncbi:hypothetical protein HRR83_008922 [Exophiala dermatitidis]|uniref:GPI anchored serine-threonine rich protein n=3 Tax=Eurotiomycetes TaxID=147545 RepID=H6BTR5_EXODN|nr:uncharacterized protein HMPREF1120_03626 [Exophiala dermatitidis NIH/UT8656]KAJ4503073.1 hypothetical protein HRR75_008178 [Exophiala dermatitidis]EHY55492.1 hypothetical protein HMPREF1120_03626 [Exophiala dermatitidis NIH/UT8656]KAJ4504256.1 hypothetical protein HRR73_008812 [Exophiala dermatitidis]KAJ4504637.1 hypothetical protein HRR74_008903 [Exophiala dermatitidis]KAJ4533514.1 hypothetical protein HRR77_008492 [Exophiala dermatitidis]